MQPLTNIKRSRKTLRCNFDILCYGWVAETFSIEVFQNGKYLPYDIKINKNIFCKLYNYYEQKII